MAAPKDIDEYLSTMSEESRVALEKLRKTIASAAPKATEGISYGVPTFKHLGPLVGFGSAKKHCALYVMSPTVMEAHKEELESYDTSKGTIRFSPDNPLPAALVRKLVKARIAENEARKAR